MEVRIRLQRSGKKVKNHYNYRIVAISKSRSRDSKNLEILGHYEPARKPSGNIELNEQKLDKWLKNGAQMSDTVRSLVKKYKKK